MIYLTTHLRRAAALGPAATLLLAAGCGDDGYKVELTDAQPAASKPIDEITWAVPYGEPVTIDAIQAGDYAPDFMVSQMLVMERGRVVERGATADLLDSPQHPYTRLLRRSVPEPGWKPRRRAEAAA